MANPKPSNNLNSSDNQRIMGIQYELQQQRAIIIQLFDLVDDLTDYIHENLEKKSGLKKKASRQTKK